MWGCYIIHSFVTHCDCFRIRQPLLNPTTYMQNVTMSRRKCNTRVFLQITLNSPWKLEGVRNPAWRTTAITRRRKPRGLHPKKNEKALIKSRLPEYLEASEVTAIIRAAPDPRSRLLMLEQWRAGLRVSEALALEAADISLDTDKPTIRVRSGKGRKARVVPVHPELAAAFKMALSYGSVQQGRLINVSRMSAWRWVQTAAARAEQLGALPPGKKLGTHTLRHNYARHLLMHGIPINYLSRWLGHSSIQTTLIYLELVPDPEGSLARIPG